MKHLSQIAPNRQRQLFYLDRLIVALVKLDSSLLYSVTCYTRYNNVLYDLHYILKLCHTSVRVWVFFVLYYLCISPVTWRETPLTFTEWCYVMEISHTLSHTHTEPGYTQPLIQTACLELGHATVLDGEAFLPSLFSKMFLQLRPCELSELTHILHLQSLCDGDAQFPSQIATETQPWSTTASYTVYTNKHYI